MLLLDYKLRVTKRQQAAIDDAIRTTQFVRNKCLRKWMDEHGVGNKCLRKWMDEHGVGDNDLQVYCAQLVKNRHLAKSIHDAGWYGFVCWVRYYAGIHGIPVVAVSPRFTTQDCSGCGVRVKKTLSMRTHVCPSCGLVLDRDQNAARNILDSARRTAGQAGTGSGSPGQNASGQTTSTAVFARARRKRAD
jgi:transposase